MVDNIADNVKPSETVLPNANAWMDLLRGEVENAAMNNSDMGALEKLIEKRVKELACPILQYGAQLVADRQEMRCPHCGSELRVEEHKRERTVKTIFGDVPIKRSYSEPALWAQA